MNCIEVSEEVPELVRNFKLPTELDFGSTIAPVMIDCDYGDGRWTALRLIPYGPISLSPASQVLHYAQEIFEGLKAYAVDGKGPFLFRPEMNAARLNASAKRMAIPELPEDKFLAAVTALTSHCAGIIPTASGQSLYLRPFVFSIDEGLGLSRSSRLKFMVIASPAGSYFGSGDLSVLIERDGSRACPGGTGAAKTGGNYAASVLAGVKAQQLGYGQTLWLDAVHGRYIEEMSGMNFFAVKGDRLITPMLTDSILAGITRDTVIQLARMNGIEVIEERMDVSEVIEGIRTGECSEAFACGTAAVITPIASLGEADGKRYHLATPEGSMSRMLRESILDIQEGRAEDPANWITRVATP